MILLFINLYIMLMLLALMVGILLIVLIIKLMRVKVWIDVRSREDQPFVTIGYLDHKNADKGAEVHQVGAFGKAPLSQIMTDDKRNVGYVDVLMTDINDDAEKPHYRRTGYLCFETGDMSVDQFGYVYKQIKGKKSKEQIGYLARPSKPNVPTIYGERSWKTLWLKCTLCAYAGVPNATPEPLNTASADTKEKPEAKTAPIERLVINARKTLLINDEKGAEMADMISSINSDEPVPTEESAAVEPAETVENKEVVEEETAASVAEPTAEDPVATVSETIEPAPAESAEEEVAEEPSAEEPSAEETPAEEAPAEEVPAEEAAEPSEQTAEETATEPEQPLPVAPDPFAALSAEEKARLDKVKEDHAALLDSILSKMVKVEAGTFMMGDDPKEDTTVDVDGKARGMVENNESPKHQVTLREFYIGRYPVTQAEWTAVMGSNPSDCQDDMEYPVAPINWFEANDYVLRLSYLTGVNFCLPTEAQWEFAARGGNRSKGTDFAGSKTFSEVGWGDHKHKVGQKKSNELGIFDMSGLVREWCSDLWGHYTEDAQTDPVGPEEGSPLLIHEVEGVSFRVVRSPSGNETVTNRKGENPTLDKNFKSYGLRIATYELPKREEKAPAPVKPLDKTPADNKPLAICSYWGFHNSKRDFLPEEARAGAYALLRQFAPRQRQPEYASDYPYGWRDTALLSAVIYTALFLLAYLINTGIFERPLMEANYWAVSIVVSYYFVLWAIVRGIKVDAIENSNSFQPILDLFNKNLGMKGMNICILAFSALAAVFTLFAVDYDFLPLIIVISIGVTINMTLPAANRRWKVQASYLEDDEDDEDDDEDVEPKNPDGDISKTYEWRMDPNAEKVAKQVEGSLTLYFKASEIKALSHLNPFFDQRNDHSDKDTILEMFHFLKEHKKTLLARTRYIAYQINQIAVKNQFTPLEKIQFTLDFVQEPNITFMDNKANKSVNFYDKYISYPDEILYEKTGDSNSKSLLAAMLFHVMGINVLYLISRKSQHAAIGVEAKPSDLLNGWYGTAEELEKLVVNYEGRSFIFCETTGDHFILGAKVAGMTLDEFDEKVMLPVREDSDENLDEDDADADDTVCRIYEWELEKGYPHTLQGRLVLDLSARAIESLRSINPFVNYGAEGGDTYEGNVASMFDYLKKDPSRTALVRKVADYVRTTTRNAGCSEVEMLQFALDFAQAPNITYVIDEQSSGIDFAKEYMRFPDEVLFDKEGDCDCKSSLTASLFLALGYNVLFMLSQKLQHAAIAVECKDAWIDMLGIDNPANVIREYNGKKYIYCETTGDGFQLGKIKDTDSIHDFETIVELTV